ncbi:MAG: hypothetical protein HC936_10820 [Leptolyngbyaceae cyanobacterium SU_3_3]|nr:hypothetical protein [Leptolyngbyaceae cyanobacterium SU_3_3]NJR51884.1 hypothetical protein [Leptolyngbyaceae cyanobacterium CSU_1_3]
MNVDAGEVAILVNQPPASYLAVQFRLSDRSDEYQLLQQIARSSSNSHCHITLQSHRRSHLESFAVKIFLSLFSVF